MLEPGCPNAYINSFGTLFQYIYLPLFQYMLEPCPNAYIEFGTLFHIGNVRTLFQYTMLEPHILEPNSSTMLEPYSAMLEPYSFFFFFFLLPFFSAFLQDCLA